MLESDEDDSDCLSPNNALSYLEKNSMIRLKGPKHDNIRSVNNFNLPRNFEKQRGPGAFAERERRPTSPVSYRSTSDRLPHREYGHELMPPPHNVQQSFYNRSYANRRHGSPTRSMISMGGCSGQGLLERRPTSPISYSSTSHQLPQREYGHSLIPPPYNAHQSFYNVGYAHSYANGRPGSPTMSMMSMGSNMSVTADAIVSAFQNTKFNKYELKNIKEAYHKLIKGRIRKRITKKRNLKMFLKGSRRISGGESGEQGSDSSLSSDDCRSTRTGVTMNGGYRNYASSSKYQRSGRNSDDARSVQTDFTDLKKIVRDNDRYKDCSGAIKQSSLKNMFSLGSRQMNNTSICRNNYSFGPAHSTTVNTTLKDRFENSFLLPSQRFDYSRAQPSIQENNVTKQIGTKNSIANTQEERFKGGFLLPSHRFNKNTTIPHLREHQDDKSSRTESPLLNVKNHKQKRTRKDLSSSSEENHNDVTVLKKITNGKKQTPKPIRKTNLMSSDELHPARKIATKQKTPEKVANQVKNTTKRFETHCNNDKEQSDFSFAKPTLPLKKPAAAKVANLKRDRNLNPEVLKPASKDVNCVPKSKDCITENHDSFEDPSDSALYTSDMSMRPSFIKRKLFTQTLEVTESKNVSTDSSPSSPPKQKRQYTNAQNEKNKTRKLVPSSSYMSRDVADDSNLLDLIHKIVPPDRMNITQQKPQNKPNLDKNQKETDDDKWDISSIINTKDVDAGSDTFTNEDIFDTNDSDFNVRPRKVTKYSPSKKMVKNSPPKKMVKNSPPKKMVKNSPPKKMVKNSPPKKVVKNCPPKNIASSPQIRLEHIDNLKNNKPKVAVVVINKLNNVRGKNVESAQTSQKTSEGNVKKPDDPVRSVLYYANKFWNCDSESDDPVTPNCRRGRSSTLMNDSYSKSLPQRNSRSKKNNINTSDNKENHMMVNGKPKPAKNVLKPVANKPTTRNNVSLNNSRESTIRILRKNNVKILQDRSITPTRQSTRLKLKLDRSRDLSLLSNK